MSIKERIENNPVAWLLGTLLAGFLAGISCYQAILKISQLDVVRKDSYIKKEAFQELQSSLDTLKLSLKNDCEPIFKDEENSSWEFINSTNIKFKYRFINSTSHKMSCIVKFKSGYCNSGGMDCELGGSKWTTKEEKTFTFVIEPYGGYYLSGKMSQFPTIVTKDALLGEEIIKTDKIE